MASRFPILRSPSTSRAPRLPDILRRTALAATPLAFALAPALALAPVALAGKPAPRCRPELEASSGVWKAEKVLKLSPAGEVQAAFDVTYDIRIDADGLYEQTNTTTLADGSQRMLSVKGHCNAEGELVVDSTSAPFDRYVARARSVGGGVILYEVESAQGGHTERYVETITSVGPDERVRTSQVVRDGAFDRLTVIHDFRQREPKTKIPGVSP